MVSKQPNFPGPGSVTSPVDLTDDADEFGMESVRFLVQVLDQAVTVYLGLIVYRMCIKNKVYNIRYRPEFWLNFLCRLGSWSGLARFCKEFDMLVYIVNIYAQAWTRT